ncbi:MAG TPA: MBL fold metallo-hydrolase [Vicinamibacterales bacterium]|nr:MBL fold metallo-hydrolase [Vicinamibacterales bacterium]
MRITFLGTGTSHGVPMIGCECATCRSTDPHDNRLRPSIFLETSSARVLVDAGPDLREQALRHRIARVDAIVFTHGHADHILGMDDVRRFNALMDGSMPCYGDAATLEDIRRMFSYVFDPATPKGGGLPQLDLRVIDGPFSVGDIHLQPVPIWHGRRRILGFRVGGFAYLTDCSRIDEAAWPLLERLEVLVLDALREKPHPTHFSLSDAIETAARIGAARTFFTHMAHDLPHEATNARLPDGMRLAHDGLVLSMPNAEC